MMLVSVVIPVYNVESYLRCCVDSVTSQTYQNIEVILVDEGVLTIRARYVMNMLQRINVYRQSIK